MYSKSDPDKLTKDWSLTFDELKLLKTKPERAHLGFVAQLKQLRMIQSR